LVDDVGDYLGGLGTSWEVKDFLVKLIHSLLPRCCRCFHGRGDPDLEAVSQTVRVTAWLTLTEGVRVEVTVMSFCATVVEGVSYRTSPWRTPTGIPWRLFLRHHRRPHPRLLLPCQGHLLKFWPALPLKHKTRHLLQGVTGCNMVLHGVTGCYRVLQGFTVCYSV
jgi:hypothetical protein